MNDIIESEKITDNETNISILTFRRWRYLNELIFLFIFAFYVNESQTIHRRLLIWNLHLGFDGLYRQDPDRYVVKRLPISDEEHKFVLTQLANTGLPPERFVLTYDVNGTVARRRLTKKEKIKTEDGIIVKLAEILIKKNKKKKIWCYVLRCQILSLVHSKWISVEKWYYILFKVLR
ncbi:MAG: hypothetical protein Ta2E_00100 [Mycoplasmoidaceae bacterium]|nr:MAG: hypothetical protein Ta2E_00100 [Mycoplasmoidaceae bacterium]